MIDIESALFTPIAEDFSETYPNGSRYNEPMETPASFPALVMYQADRFYSGYTGLNSSRVVIDVDVFSNLTAGAKQQCKDIIELVEERLGSIGAWETVFCNQIRNADQRIFRVKARYRGTAVEETNEDDTVTVRIYKD